MDGKKILIVGDSFCAPNESCDTWYNFLSEKYCIENRGQAGVGQSKIHGQLANASGNYSAIIYLITSPYRIHTESNPFYDPSHPSHANADLIYEDVKSRLPDMASQHIVWWFKNVFDPKQALFIHDLIVEHDCNQVNVIPITFFDSRHLSNPKILNLESIWRDYPGSVNHLNPKGHRLVFSKIDKILDQIFLTLIK